MSSSSVFAAIRHLISQNEIEEALEQLVTALSNRPDQADLLRIARVNQAALFQNKADKLRGAINAEDAQIAMNKIAAAALELTDRAESGKRLDNEKKDDDLPAPTSRQAWRYYLAGAIIAATLGVLAWVFFFKTKDCPSYGDSKSLKVMILPFKKWNNTAGPQREFDLSDGINDYILKDAMLQPKAEADVNENYDIEANYPNPSEASLIGDNCGVDMVVWGKSTGDKDTIEVRYKLLRPIVRMTYSADSILNRLLSPSPEGVLINDYRMVSKMLYLVLVSQNQSQPLALDLKKEVEALKAVTVAMSDANQTDTTQMLTQARLLIETQQYDNALAIYDRILTRYPDQQTALRLRGSILLLKKDYDGARLDFEALAANATTTNTDVLQKSVESSLRSGHPEQAAKNLETLKQTKTVDPNWIKTQEKAVRDSTSALEVRAAKFDAAVKKQPDNLRTNLAAAKSKLGLGDNVSALKSAEKALKIAPKNAEAVEVAIEANLKNGDKERATEIMEKAEQNGVNVKSSRWKPVLVKPLKAN